MALMLHMMVTTLAIIIELQSSKIFPYQKISLIFIIDLNYLHFRRTLRHKYYSRRIFSHQYYAAKKCVCVYTLVFYIPPDI